MNYNISISPNPKDKRFVDLINKTFTNLTVIGYFGKQLIGNKLRQMWWCECSCNEKNIIKVRHDSLLYNSTKSCGCLIKKSTSERFKSTHTEFLNKINLLSGNKILSIYENSRKKILVEDKYGICEVLPQNLINNHPSSIKSAIDKTSYWINQAREIHGNRYDYSLVEYKNNKTKIKIICKIHGIFEQPPGVHLRKHNCKSCTDEESGFKKTHFLNKCRDKDGIFYILKCFNDEEEFYKIGITSRSVKQRYLSKIHLPYDFDIIKEYKSKAEEIWNLEKQLLRENKQFKYKPKLSFAGEGECFNSLFLEQNKVCNQLMDEDGIDKSYRIVI